MSEIIIAGLAAWNASIALSAFATVVTTPPHCSRTKRIISHVSASSSVDGERCVSPINFRTVKPGLRENAELVKQLLVGILFGPIRQVIAAFRLSDAVLRHEVQPIPEQYAVCRFRHVHRAITIQEDTAF